MKIAQKFTVARSPAEVWVFFEDVPAVARCMPGAEITEDKGDGLYAGKVKVRLGPFGANFEGEAKVSTDPATWSGHVEGKGVDRRGGSRTRMVMDYRLQPAGDGTEVTVDADVTLAGAIAQFGRTGLIQETANLLVQDFVAALERELAPTGTAPAATAASTAATRPDEAHVAATAPPPAGAAPSSAATPRAEASPSRAAPPPAGASQAFQRHDAPEAASGAEPAPSAMSAATAKPWDTEAPSRQPAPRAIGGGSLALRALWAWLKSLLRGLLGTAKR